MMVVREPGYSWLVIATRPRSEKKVAMCLQRLGIDYYLPVQRQLHQWKDRKKWVDVVLFPSYVFVYLDKANRNAVFEVEGVLRFVSFQGRPAVVSQSDLQRISLLCSGPEVPEICREVLLSGDRVEVVGGALCGLQGVLTENLNESRLNVSISGLGCHLSVIIDRKLVRKL
ncbi:UpxY family transcription antiterminator [Rurimicrobium arvi]|uniref:UpxY family transcription antiterminator n=1 Tax=Rurimicrobium arvi TaxID=2049916 RepID=A0ABP8MPY6_9BACT